MNNDNNITNGSINNNANNNSNSNNNINDNNMNNVNNNNVNNNAKNNNENNENKDSLLSSNIYDKVKEDLKALLKKYNIDVNDPAIKKLLDDRIFDMLKFLLAWVIFKR